MKCAGAEPARVPNGGASVSKPNIDSHQNQNGALSDHINPPPVNQPPVSPRSANINTSATITAPKLVGQPPTPVQNEPGSADCKPGGGAPTYQRPPGIQTLQVPGGVQGGRPVHPSPSRRGTIVAASKRTRFALQVRIFI